MASGPQTESKPKGRVLFVTGRLTPTADCRFTMALARQLGVIGWDVQIVGRSGSISTVYPRECSQSKSPHNPPIWLSRALSPNVRGFLSRRALIQRVRQLELDLVHVHGANLAGIGSSIAHAIKKPYVLSVDELPEPGFSNIPRKNLSKVIVTSDAVRVDLVNEYSIPRDIIEIVPLGIEPPPAAPTEDKSGKTPVVGTIDSLEVMNGHEHFIRAAYQLIENGRDLRFVIAGEGGDRKRLQNLVEELELNEWFTFARAPVDQLDVLRALDIMVVPAMEEALTLPLIEAMSHGIPVIASSAGGVFKLIENGRNGILVAKGEHEPIAKQIEYLLDNPSVAHAIGTEGRKTAASESSIVTTAEQTSQAYFKLIENK